MYSSLLTVPKVAALCVLSSISAMDCIVLYTHILHDAIIDDNQHIILT